MNRPPLALPLAALALLLACHPHPGAAPAPRTTYLHEVEVNDTPGAANWVGELRVGEQLVIDGDVTECCPDPFDGFSLFATGPMTLRLVLRELAPGADLDLALYLPAIDEVVAAFETPLHPEIGHLDVHGPLEVHAVVRSFTGDSPYRLEILALPLQPGLAAGQGTGPETRRVFGAYAPPAPGPVR